MGGRGGRGGVEYFTDVIGLRNYTDVVKLSSVSSARRVFHGLTAFSTQHRCDLKTWTCTENLIRRG